MARYLRKDYENGYMTETVQIEYYKKVQEFDIINNLLIGDFNSKGEYVTTKDILQELKAMPKYIKKTFNTNMYLESNAQLNNFNQITFMIVVQDGVPKHNMSRGSLLLTEEISKCAGKYINTNSVVVDTFEDINDLDFNEKMFQKFNVVPQGIRKGAKSEVPLNILNRKTEVFNAQQNLFSALHKPLKEFLDKRLSTYKQFEIGAKIAKDYTSRLAEIKATVPTSDVKYPYYQNELLDMVLDEYDYKKDRAFKKAVDECMAFYCNLTKTIDFSAKPEVQTSSRAKIKSSKSE